MEVLLQTGCNCVRLCVVYRPPSVSKALTESNLSVNNNKDSTEIRKTIKDSDKIGIF